MYAVILYSCDHILPSGLEETQRHTHNIQIITFTKPIIFYRLQANKKGMILTSKKNNKGAIQCEPQVYWAHKHTHTHTFRSTEQKQKLVAAASTASTTTTATAAITATAAVKRSLRQSSDDDGYRLRHVSRRSN